MGSLLGKLSKEDIAFLKLHTNCDEKTIKKLYKEFKKKSRKGKMSPALFYEMYQKLCPNDKNARDFCNHVFRTFDADNNGYVSFKEFLLALNVNSCGNPEDKLKWAFKLYDINGDGVINRCEMIIIIESMFEMLDDVAMKRKNYAKERAKEVFTKLDTNNDLRLSKDEFVSGCLEDDELTKLLTHHACAIGSKSLEEAKNVETYKKLET